MRFTRRFYRKTSLSSHLLYRLKITTLGDKTPRIPEQLLSIGRVLQDLTRPFHRSTDSKFIPGPPWIFQQFLVFAARVIII
jgi:hypothetical protein